MTKKLFAVLVCLGLAGCSVATDESIDSKSAEKLGPGYQLAVVDAGGSLLKSDAEFAIMPERLKGVEGKFPEGEKQVADLTVVLWGRLSDVGIKESCKSLLEGAGAAKNQKSYKDWCASYFVLRKSGQGHEASLRIINALASRVK